MRTLTAMLGLVVVYVGVCVGNIANTLAMLILNHWGELGEFTVLIFGLAMFFVYVLSGFMVYCSSPGLLPDCDNVDGDRTKDVLRTVLWALASGVFLGTDAMITSPIAEHGYYPWHWADPPFIFACVFILIPFVFHLYSGFLRDVRDALATKKT